MGYSTCATNVELKRKKREMQCYKTDEGRPFGICLQKPVPNRPRLRWLNGQGGERRGKRLGKEPSQVTDKKMNASEPLITCRKRRDDIKTMESRCHGTSLGETCLRPKRYPVWRWHDLVGGCYMERGNLNALMQTEKFKRKKREDESRKVEFRGGTTRSSDEAIVMKVERRGCHSEVLFAASTRNGRNR